VSVLFTPGGILYVSKVAVPLGVAVASGYPIAVLSVSHCYREVSAKSWLVPISKRMDSKNRDVPSSSPAKS